MSGVAVAGAAIAIGVTIDTGTTLAIVAAVGATIGAVGVVTNNQTLKIAGGVIGAVGAIGGLASAAGLFSGAAGGGSSLFDAGGLASDGGFAGAVGSDVAAGGGSALSATDQVMVDAGLQSGTQSAGISSSVTPDIVNMASGQVSIPGTPDATSVSPTGGVNSADPTVGTAAPSATPTAATNTGVPDTAPAGGTASASVQGDLTSQGVPVTSSVAAPTVPGAPPAPTSTTNSILNGGQGVTGVPAPSTQQALVDAGLSPGTQSPGVNSDVMLGGAYSPSTSSAFSNVLSFLGKNGTLASGAIQAGAALIAGATDSLKPAQVAALNAQANVNQAAANLSAQQLSNIQGRTPVATRTPAPAPTPAGLINSQPQKPAVTGQVAA